MSRAADLLSRYAEYHRDRRNIASHFVGVPLIVFAVGVLLGRPEFSVGDLALTPAWIVFAALAAWFLTRGDLGLGLAVSAGVGAVVFLSQPFARGGTAGWLATGFCTLVVGWIVQFVGHWYEGRKPAFVDDAVGLLVAPMFLTAEALFAFGWNPRLQAHIEQRAGPTQLRDLAKIA